MIGDDPPIAAAGAGPGLAATALRLARAAGDAGAYAGGGSNTGFDGYKRVADGGTYGGNGHGGYDGYVKPKPVKHAARKTRVADGGAGIDGYMRVAGGTSGGNGFGGYDGYSKRRYSGQNMRVAGGGNGSVGGEGGIDGYKKKPVKQRVAHKSKSKQVKDSYGVRTVQ